MMVAIVGDRGEGECYNGGCCCNDAVVEDDE